MCSRRRAGRSSRLGEFLDHWLDTLNNGFVTLGACLAVGLPALMALGVFAVTTLAFFAVQWELRRTGVFRMGRIADVEGNTAVCGLYLLIAFAGPGYFAWAPVSGLPPLAIWLGVAVGGQAAWTFVDAFRRVAADRLDLVPLSLAFVLLLGWAVASAVGVAVGLYFRPHYFFQTLPPLVGLAAFALAGATAPTLRRSSIGPTLGVALACAAVAIVPPLAADAPIRAAGSPGDISRAIYGTNPFVESEAIGDYIRRTSDTDDRVYVVGSEPQILFHARRVSATRYIFLYPLTGDYSDARERQRELVKEVKAAKPLYVVWTNIPTSLLLDVRSETYVLAHARAMLDRDYRLELVAYPMSSEGRFDFAYGMNARRIMKEAGERSRSAQWIGVYRRKDAAPSTR